MHTLRLALDRLLAFAPAFAARPYPRAVVLLLVLIVPGGVVVPICFGLYGALRACFTGRSTAEPPVVIAPLEQTGQPDFR